MLLANDRGRRDADVASDVREAEAEYHTRQNALSWPIDPVAATEIDARLAAYGFDQEAITIEVYVHARELLVLFKGLLNAPQTKRMLLLREIRNQRWIGARSSRENGAQGLELR